MLKVSVIIPAFNEEASTIGVFEAVSAQRTVGR